MCARLHRFKLRNEAKVLFKNQRAWWNFSKFWKNKSAKLLPILAKSVKFARVWEVPRSFQQCQGRRSGPESALLCWRRDAHGRPSRRTWCPWPRHRSCGSGIRLKDYTCTRFPVFSCRICSRKLSPLHVLDFLTTDSDTEVSSENACWYVISRYT